MSGYQYTYPADTSYLNVLRPELREIANSMLNRAAEHGADLADLMPADLPAKDKAAIAAVFGGPDAAKEYLP